MNRNGRKSLVTAVAIVLSSISWAQYQAVLLHPSGFSFSEAYSGGAGQQVGHGIGPATGGNEHALLWAGSAGSLVDLNPSGFSYSSANGAFAGNQVGAAGGPAIGNLPHAMLWSGTAASRVDLHPSGYDGSEARGIRGSQQVGNALLSAGVVSHAMVWTGSAASAVDLHPAGYDSSYALATDGLHQVGYAYGTSTGSFEHAILWSGTAGSAVDLTPSTMFTTQASAVDGITQGGYGVGTVATNNEIHALLWNGTAGSVVDLNPAGSTESTVNGILGGTQVGYSVGGSGNLHATLWKGTAASAVDLHGSLGSLGAFEGSYAMGISPDGSIVGAATDVSGNTFAVMWAPVPEPSTLVALGLILGSYARKRFRANKPKLLAFASLSAIASLGSAQTVWYNGDAEGPGADGYEALRGTAEFVTDDYTEFEDFTWNSSSTAKSVTSTFIATSSFTSLVWEVRTGMATHVAGNLIASGTAQATLDDLGVWGQGAGWHRYSVTANIGSLVLNNGSTYWLGLAAVTPSSNFDAAIMETKGANSIGSPVNNSNNLYRYEATGAVEQNPSINLSMGISASAVPEPCSVVAIGCGLVGLLRRIRKP